LNISVTVSVEIRGIKADDEGVIQAENPTLSTKIHNRTRLLKCSKVSAKIHNITRLLKCSKVRNLESERNKMHMFYPSGNSQCHKRV
jgi:hypothetical protein